MPPSSPKKRRRSLRWLAALAGGLAALALAEAAARLYCRLHPVRPLLQQFHPFLGYCLKPNGRIVLRDRFGERVYSTNSIGLRGRDVPRRKGPRTFRIICVGGSTTENCYVNDDETYPAQLERLLQKRCPDLRVEVLNAGLSGYSTAHTLINFQLNLVELKPDLLVVYQAVNDLMPMSFPDFWPDYRNFYKIYHLRRAVETDLRRGLDPRWPAWLRRSGLGRLLLRARRGMMSWPGLELRGRPRPTLARVPDDALRVYERNLREFITLARAAGCRVCLVTFALVIHPGMSADEVERLRPFPWFYYLSPPAVADAVRRMNDILKRLRDEEHVLLVDHAARTPKSYDYFIDVCHMNARGCRLLAEHVAQGLLRARAVRLTPTKP